MVTGKNAVFEHAKISVWVDPANGLVHHQIHAPVAGEVFHEALLKGLEAMIRYRGDTWLSDDRLNGALLPEDLVWVRDTWSPKMVAAGWKRWAIVLPRSLLGEVTIQKHIELYRGKSIDVKSFDTPEAALQWLQR